MSFFSRIHNFFRKDYVANKCGHKTKIKGRVCALGENFTLEMPLAENKKPDFCLDCISKMSIRCAWCGEPIHIGDPVTTLCVAQDYIPPEYAVRYEDNSFVGCLSWGCGEAIFRSGFWMPPGVVHRVMSPIEMVISSGSAVFVQDLSDPNNIGKII